MLDLELLSKLAKEYSVGFSEQPGGIHINKEALTEKQLSKLLPAPQEELTYNQKSLKIDDAVASKVEFDNEFDFAC